MPKSQTGPKSIHRDEYLALCALLAETRVAQGITQVELARRLGASQPYISHVENGDVRLDPVQLLLWLEACGVDPLSFHEAFYGRVRPAKRKKR
jgi:transcriptional regulator with XRE-family HTH domain